MTTPVLPHHRQILIPLLLLPLPAALPGASRVAQDSDPQGVAFAQAIDEVCREALGPGVAQLVVAVDAGGERIYSRGFGDGAPPDGDTPFHAGPLLSCFLSVAALSLAAEERLDLEAPLSEHLPDLPYGELGVRLDQLLTQTSGIPGYGDLLRSARRRAPDDDRERILAWLRNGPLDSAPGTCARYSNTNDLLLGLALERVAGKGVQALLAETIFAPARMESTEFVQGARAHAPAPVEQEFAGELEDQAGADGPFDAELLVSTAHDLLRFQRALVEKRLLPPEALELRASEPRLPEGSSAGYGRGISLTRLSGQTCHAAGGGAAGQRVQLAYYPAQDIAVVVWATGEQVPVRQISARVGRALLALEMPVVRDLATSAGMRARHEGDYYVGCSSYVVVDEEEHLVLYPPEGTRTVLLHQGGESFAARDDPDLTVEFEVEEGRVVALVLTEHGIPLRAKRFF